MHLIACHLSKFHHFSKKKKNLIVFKIEDGGALRESTDTPTHPLSGCLACDTIDPNGIQMHSYALFFHYSFHSKTAQAKEIAHSRSNSLCL